MISYRTFDDGYQVVPEHWRIKVLSRSLLMLVRWEQGEELMPGGGEDPRFPPHSAHLAFPPLDQSLLHLDSPLPPLAYFQSPCALTLLRQSSPNIRIDLFNGVVLCQGKRILMY